MPAKTSGETKTAGPLSTVGRTLKRRPRAKHGRSVSSGVASEPVERSISELFRLTLDIKQRLGLG